MKAKIVTINTWKCEGRYWERMVELAYQLKKLDADIIVCQECFRSEQVNADTLLFLSRELEMDYIEERARHKKRRFEDSMVDSTSGLGILSKYKMKKMAVHGLPHNDLDNDRRVLQVLVELPIGERIVITNTHLTHIADRDLQMTQSKTLAEIVMNSAEYDCHLVCGDFNSTINSEPIRNFIEQTNAIDCYAKGGGEEPRHSFLDAFLIGENLCLDHLFLISGHKIEIDDAKIVLNTKRASGVYPSDHFGVSATLIHE